MTKPTSTGTVHPARRSGPNSVVVLAASVAALGGFLFGYDTGVISAALLYITPEFGLSETGQQIVVASLLLGAMAGVLVGSPLVDRIGRKLTLLFTSAVFALGAVAAALAMSVEMLVVARVVLGVAVGASSVVVPTYIAEIAPKASRGWLVSLNQLMLTAGIFVSYLIGYALAESQNWRWMVGLAAIPAVIMFVGLFTLPESPRWLASHGRQDEARSVLMRSRTEAEATEELAEIAEASRAEARFTFRDLLTPRLRPAVVLGVTVAAASQLVGVNAVIYYTPTLLKQSGFGDSAAILSSVGIGAVLMVVTGLTLVFIDRVGRRPLLLGGIGTVVASLVYLGTLYLVYGAEGIPKLPLVIGLCVYIAAFAASLGVAIWLINSEIFPTAVRGKAAGLGIMTHWGLDFLVSLTVLTAISAMTATGVFWMYAVFGVISFVILQRRLPETKGRSLEEIEQSLQKH
ncbi:sugar porter family MFS transporter [Rhodococcoides corynebacterioides]|uniref:sugar porter family MFS transporter n=1 Tax=Rhodococcoides corynebacterioides TaxID=53972 RepID=UPI001C9B01C9|nr:sugar porter family MFS transporter [Rhodococcus corynebacterioides]MBY6362497.1 sugar porter family MFS transporter [Rhodococcus corynebacterioides]